jgi:hypothetical protein
MLWVLFTFFGVFALRELIYYFDISKEATISGIQMSSLLWGYHLLAF